MLALAYRASLQIINEISPEGQRAEVLAALACAIGLRHVQRDFISSFTSH